MIWDWAYAFEILPQMAAASLVTLQATLLGFALATARRQFRALEARDVSGFADVNTAYRDALTGLVTNHVLREIMRALFFQTARIWLMGLPHMDWALTIDRISWELDELRRAMPWRWAC